MNREHGRQRGGQAAGPEPPTRRRSRHIRAEGSARQTRAPDATMARKRRGGKNRKPPTAQPPPRQETKEATEAITYASEDDIDSRDDLDDAYDDDDASTAASTTSRSDVSELDGEGSEGDRPGGYHPVRIGDVFHARYTVVEKLGWGHFSTVWACKDADGDALVALKVQKSAAHYADAALDEIDLLRHARRVADDEAKNWNNQGDDPRVASSRVVRLLDHFEHQGPNGRHVCMVFELLGVNLLSVIRKSEYHGLPVDAVRAMTKQICLGLDFLHRKCAIIHTVSDSAWILNLTPSTRVGSVRRGRGWSRRWRLRAPRESRGGFATASVPHRTSNPKMFY